MNRTIVLTLFALLLLGGCAMQPNQHEINQLPVITFGESVPGNSDFILYFPAGEDIPTEINIEGNIFQAARHETIKVKLKRDLYNYKTWISYDKQRWYKGKDKLETSLDIKIPGYHYPKPGHITLNLSETQE